MLFRSLAERWQALKQPEFTIIETGFGTGLNFLSCAKLWLETSALDYTLHFISVEKYPLSMAEIFDALDLWPSLTVYKQALLEQYPEVLNGKSVLLFDDRIRFTLLTGDATEQLNRLSPSITKADAWFLDGFAPSKNPEMWQPSLFQQMTRLSYSETTFATFTSAGEVRRNLIAAGFTVQKRPGFGKKREMLVGIFDGMHVEMPAKTLAGQHAKETT